MTLVDSVKAAKDRVGEAFDTLITDIEQEDGGVDSSVSKVTGVTVRYEDGTTVDYSPPSSPTDGTPDEVKDLTGEAQRAGEAPDIPSTTGTPQQGDVPGNSEQL